MKNELVENIQYIPINQINPFDAFHTKAEDGFVVNDGQTEAHMKSIKFIKKHILEGGKIRPILIKEVGDKSYGRLDGFCRYWAYKELGRDKIPCIFGTMRGGQGLLSPFINEKDDA